MIMEKGITFPTKGSWGLMVESRTHNRKVVSSSLGPAGIVVGGSECPALSTPLIPRLRCLWAVHTHSSEHTHTEPQTAPRVSQHKWLPTAPGVCVCVHGVCVHCCVCALWMGKMQSTSMGYHTWLYVTSLSLSFPTRLVVFGQSQCTVSAGQSEQTVLVGRRDFVENEGGTLLKRLRETGHRGTTIMYSIWNVFFIFLH